jgi:hypothetical protein
LLFSEVRQNIMAVGACSSPHGNWEVERGRTRDQGQDRLFQ